MRCTTCGKPIGGLWEKYSERTKKGEESKKVLNELGIDRYCCRALLMTQFDTLKEVARFRA